MRTQLFCGAHGIAANEPGGGCIPLLPPKGTNIDYPAVLT